jgi:hypothetical protein
VSSHNYKDELISGLIVGAISYFFTKKTVQKYSEEADESMRRTIQILKIR